jgi:hypothetical protein
MTIQLYEKLETGELIKISERPWDDKFMKALEAANYLMVKGKEYEMVEGRLNLDLDVFELLLIQVSGKDAEKSF